MNIEVSNRLEKFIDIVYGELVKHKINIMTTIKCRNIAYRYLRKMGFKVGKRDKILYIKEAGNRKFVHIYLDFYTFEEISKEIELNSGKTLHEYINMEINNYEKVLDSPRYEFHISNNKYDIEDIDLWILFDKMYTIFGINFDFTKR